MPSQERGRRKAFPAERIIGLKPGLTSTVEQSTIDGDVALFTELGDVPESYSGAAGKLVAVTALEDALEFVDIAGQTSDQQIIVGSLPYTIGSSYARSVFLIVDPATSGGTVTLPAASGYIGRQIIIHVPDAAGAGIGTVTVAAPGGSTLYNATTIVGTPGTRVFRPDPTSGNWYQVLAVGGTTSTATARAINANLTLTASHRVIEVSTTTAAVTLTLPARAAANDEVEYTIIDVGNNVATAGRAVSLNTNVADAFLDGTTSKGLATNRARWQVRATKDTAGTRRWTLARTNFGA